jgi:hypothetical protein
MSQYDFDLRSEADKAKEKQEKMRLGKGRDDDPYKKFEGDDFPGFVLSRSTVGPLT